MSNYRSGQASHTSCRAASGRGTSRGRNRGRSEHENLFRRIRQSKAFALLMTLVFVLTIGELSGDPAIPSWSSLYGEISAELTEYISEQNSQPTTSPSDVIIHVIDVGQGDCMLLQSEDYDILIDAGENGMGSRVSQYLESVGVTQLDLIVATHPHSDHMGGIDTVIEEIGADEILMIFVPEEHKVEHNFYLSVLEAIEANSVKVSYANEGDIYTYGSLSLEVLHPTYGEYRDDVNDMSICLAIRCGGFGVIACGDITYEVEEELLKEGHDLDADIFVANHHGSALSNSEEFITAIDPDYVVFSCGAGNSYGHPHNSIIRLLERLGIEYYRTDKNGTVVISCIDGGIYINTKPTEGE